MMRSLCIPIEGEPPEAPEHATGMDIKMPATDIHIPKRKKRFMVVSSGQVVNHQPSAPTITHISENRGEFSEKNRKNKTPLIAG